jgi:hypothetical protein
VRAGGASRAPASDRRRDLVEERGGGGELAALGGPDRVALAGGGLGRERRLGLRVVVAVRRRGSRRRRQLEYLRENQLVHATVFT